jgi:hypothetical protein
VCDVRYVVYWAYLERGAVGKVCDIFVYKKICYKSVKMGRTPLSSFMLILMMMCGV